MSVLAERLAARLSEPLPGLAAQATMAPAGRISDNYDPNPPGARASAVLIVVTPGGKLAFIRRSEDGRAHSGQMAFPGGMREDHDPDMLATALREAEEEIGLSRSVPEVAGGLSPLHIPVTNFTVWPFVGFIDSVPEFVCQPGEVDEVVLLPISGMAGARTEMDWHSNGTTYRVPTYRFGNIDVWGATAMITAEFLSVWEEVRG